MLCKVCYHPKYAEIYDLIKAGDSTLSLSRRFDLDRRVVERHRNADPPHPPPKGRNEDGSEKEKKTRPKKDESDEREPLPTSDEIVATKDRDGRKEILAQFIDRGKWRNLESARRFHRLWPDMSFERIASLAAEAADEVRAFRGPRRLRREVMIAEGWNVFRKAMSYGQLPAALNALRFVAELDGLVYEPGLVDALLETQAWKIIEPLLQREAPKLWEKFVALVEMAERARVQAEEVARNPAPLLVEAETVRDAPESNETAESFAASRNGGRRPRVEPPAETRDDKADESTPSSGA